jgi:hypothetical protein
MLIAGRSGTGPRPLSLSSTGSFLKLPFRKKMGCHCSSKHRRKYITTFGQLFWCRHFTFGGSSNGQLWRHSCVLGHVSPRQLDYLQLQVARHPYPKYERPLVGSGSSERVFTEATETKPVQLAFNHYTRFQRTTSCQADNEIVIKRRPLATNRRISLQQVVRVWEYGRKGRLRITLGREKVQRMQACIRMRYIKPPEKRSCRDVRIDR